MYASLAENFTEKDKYWQGNLFETFVIKRTTGDKAFQNNNSET